MKPFNLDEALAGKPVVNGNNERVFITKPIIPMPNNLVCMSQNSKGVVVAFHTPDGKVQARDSSYYNLYMAPTEKTVWVNFYDDRSACFYGTKEEADKFHAYNNRLGGKAQKVTIEI